MITLTTDFGSKDFYLAQMKGVILNLNKRAQILDITHEIKKHDIFEGSFVLSQVWNYFPKGTIHVGVIDPGVGSERKGIIIRTEHCYFVGPDNGLFSLACRGQKVERIIEIDENKICKLVGKNSNDISQTFHGRDIFAPVAAMIDNGHYPLDFFGKEIKGEIGKLGIRRGSVLYIDGFGNVITGLEGDYPVGKTVALKHRGRKHKVVMVRTFSDGKIGEMLLIRGSHGLLEVDIREGSAAKKLNARVGNRIEIV